jgi:predicted O-methyltransferase YrrM
MFNIQQFLYRLWAWARFYLRANTKYRVHSPFVFQWTEAVLEDDRNYYAFGAIQALRQQLRAQHAPIEVTDFGAGAGGAHAHAHAGAHKRKTTLAKVTAGAASDDGQGIRLFRLAQWHQPGHLLELGSCVGLGTAYLALATSSKAQFTTLEGCPVLADVARLNLDTLGAKHVNVVAGAFESTLQPALAQYAQLDLVYFDGNHRATPTLAYFHACLPKIHDRTVFIFDDIHWSAEMERAWADIQAHERVTLSIDCGHFGCVYFAPEHKAKQHFSLIEAAFKPWQKFF